MSLPLVTARHITAIRTVDAEPVITRCGMLRMLEYTRDLVDEALSPDASSKRTSDAPSCNLALKRNQFSVHSGTMTHTSSISGLLCQRSPRANPRGVVTGARSSRSAFRAPSTLRATRRNGAGDSTGRRGSREPRPPCGCKNRASRWSTPGKPSPTTRWSTRHAPAGLLVVRCPTVFETSHAPSQQRYFRLDSLGEAGWLEALRLDEYAPRRP